VEVKNETVFTLGSDLRLAYSPHLGWDRAEARLKKLDPKLKDQTIADKYQTPARSVVLAIYAGADVRYGKFVKTLYASRFLYPGTWADPIRVK